jgi:hypothetical protein
MTGISSPQNKYLDVKKSILNQIDTNSTPEYIFGEYINPKEVMIELINSHRRTINKNLIPKIFNGLSFLRTNEYKYIKYNNINFEEFYNLSNDPHEQFNIINVNNENYKKMKSYTDNLKKKIIDPNELKDVLTKKEKDFVKKIINGYKIKGI